MEWRVEHAPPESPEAELAVLASGAALAREAAAQALGARWGIPVVALLGRDLEDPGALRERGVVAVRWPHAPLQVQEAVLAALGEDPGARRMPPPGAPLIRRGKERRPAREN